MRIGIDARLTYYTRGGISNYIRQIVQQIPPLDPHNDYFILHSWKAKENLDAKRINCFTPAHHRFERLALGVEMIPRQLDLLHSPDFISPHGAFKKVITIHDLAFLHYPKFLTLDSRRYYHDQIRDAASRAEAIITVSESAHADVINLLNVPAEKITTIYEAPDAKFRPLPKEDVDAVTARLGIPNRYLLFVGTFEPRKNVDGLIRAYATIKDTPPLVIAGNKGWLFEETFKLVYDMKLENRIHFIQDVSPDDIVSLYNAALGLVLPSHYEGFGFPVLEAFACGVPVIISSRASLPELANGSALICDPDDLTSIAYTIQQALSDSQLRESLIEKGFKRVKDFSWEKCARETLEVYRTVLSK
ncbi:MAG: glycosyltransferase family 4 protein [Chloroflexi bacterium]|nr:glycosyltransferase family 4 protein [Chloroflexota bacterium]